MSIMFDWSSQSWAPFAGERRFSKSRGLSASVSFLPLPHPLFLILLSPQFRAGKIPFLGVSLLLNPTETLASRLLGKHRYNSVTLRRAILKPEKRQTTSDVLSSWVFLDGVLRVHLIYLLVGYCPWPRRSIRCKKAFKTSEDFVMTRRKENYVFSTLEVVPWVP